MKNKLTPADIAFILLMIAFLFFIDYGRKTSCPDVAVYVKCKNYFKE